MNKISEKPFWTVPKKLIFLGLTIAPLLLSFLLSYSTRSFWHMSRLQDEPFSFLELFAGAWEDMMILFSLPHFLLIFGIAIPLFLFWWFAPSFLKSYVIVLFVLLVCWRLNAVTFGGLTGYIASLDENPTYLPYVPDWFKFIIYHWPG